jgi:electron transfer flavoprotein beta subunit
MEIVVCIKRTPDTTARVKPSGDGKALDPQGVEFIINPYDELAIEQAVRTKEKLGGTVTAVMLDPEANQTIMRKAMAMGIDKGIILQGGQTFDAFGVAKALAGAIQKQKFDIVFCGKQGIDDDNYQVPSMLAYLLGIPRVNVVIKMDIADNIVTANRQIEGGEEVVKMKLPCLVSCQRGLNEPRFPSLKGIMDAKKKPLEVVKLDSFESTLDVVKLESPPSRPPGRIVANVNGKTADDVRKASQELIRLLKEEAKVL